VRSATKRLTEEIKGARRKLRGGGRKARIGPAEGQKTDFRRGKRKKGTGRARRACHRGGGGILTTPHPKNVRQIVHERRRGEKAGSREGGHVSAGTQDGSTGKGGSRNACFTQKEERENNRRMVRPERGLRKSHRGWESKEGGRV